MSIRRDTVEAVAELRRRSGERGVTLIELLVAMSILGIILTVMGFSITESLTQSSNTQGTVNRSNLADFAARYFAADVASSPTGRLITPHNPTVPPPCGGGGSVVDIPTNDPTKAPATTISYVVDAATHSFYRRLCNAATQTGQLLLGRTRDPFNSTASASCASTCTVTVSWSTPTYSFTLRGYRRVP